jgi:hypothetical protein
MRHTPLPILFTAGRIAQDQLGAVAEVDIVKMVHVMGVDRTSRGKRLVPGKVHVPRLAGHDKRAQHDEKDQS